MKFQPQLKNLKHWESAICGMIFLSILWGQLLSFYSLSDRNFHSFLMSDEAVYAWQAEKIVKNLSDIASAQVNEHHPPLFPVLLAAGKTLNNELPPIIAYRLTALTISIITIIALYFLGTSLSGPALGLFCVIGLTGFHTFSWLRFFILNDMLFMLWGIILIFLISRLKPTSTNRLHLAISLTLLMALLTKWSAMILIPFVLLSYLLLYSPNIILGLRKFLLFPGLISASMLKLVVPSAVRCLGIQPIFHLRHTLISGYWLYCYFFKEIGLLMILGILFGCWTKNKFLMALSGFFAIGLAGDLLLPQTDARYVFYLQPAILILAGMGGEGLLKRVFQKERPLMIAKLMALFLFAFLIEQYTPSTSRISGLKTNSLDYASATAWINENITSDHIIVSQEHRSIRYFTGLEYLADGGRLYECPAMKSDLKKLVEGTDKSILLEVNAFREQDGTDFLPFSKEQQTEDFLKGLGFSLKKEIFDLNSSTRIPAIKIFERKPVSP
ncbi:MAG TPA: hypothetical protein P5246_00305 [Candidatus Omnitrophota bacterium]|nr:hypothetical protein [Candidatus Omnitrophota bacterium]HSA31336.1 hypothetical protein [Candidatus Omnitrophota bacterium]